MILSVYNFQVACRCISCVCRCVVYAQFRAFYKLNSPNDEILRHNYFRFSGRYCCSRQDYCFCPVWILSCSCYGLQQLRVCDKTNRNVA